MSAGHTREPWNCDGAVLDFDGARYGEVAYVLSKDGAVLTANKADARLIAAAPELLEALQEAANLCVGTFAEGGSPHKRMLAAIAKATGGAA